MGLRAGYQYLSDENLTKLKACSGDEEVFDYLEAICADSDEDFADMLDIDKMWDVLHFTLTEADDNMPEHVKPLSEAVMGATPIEDIENHVAYTDKSKIAAIVAALNAFNIDKAIEAFSMEACAVEELYPYIWDREDETEEIKEELLDCFTNMRAFYRKALETNSNVLVGIY